MQHARLKVSEIAPFYEQPRQEFDDERTAELAESLREKGQVEPVVVRRSPKGVDRPFQLISGERRWRAAQLIGLSHLEAVVREDVGSDDEQFELAVAANAAREDLTPIDQARTVKRLAEMPARLGLKGQALVKSLAGVFGRSTTWIDQHLRLAGLAPEVQALVESGELKKDAAVALADIKQPERQAEIAKRVAGQNLRAGVAINAVKQQVRVEQARAGEAPRSGGTGRPARGVGATASSDAKLVADLVARARQAADSALDMPVTRLTAAYRMRPAERAAVLGAVDTAIQKLRRLRAALDQVGNGGVR